MNLRFFDDLVSSALRASQGSEKENIQHKITQQRLLKKFWKIYIKFLKFQKYLKIFSTI